MLAVGVQKLGGASLRRLLFVPGRGQNGVNKQTKPVRCSRASYKHSGRPEVCPSGIPASIQGPLEGMLALIAHAESSECRRIHSHTWNIYITHCSIKVYCFEIAPDSATGI